MKKHKMFHLQRLRKKSLNEFRLVLHPNGIAPKESVLGSKDVDPTNGSELWHHHAFVHPASELSFLLSHLVCPTIIGPGFPHRILGQSF